MIVSSGSPLGQVGAKYHLIFNNPSYPALNTNLGMTSGQQTIEAQGQLTTPSASTGFDGDIQVQYYDFTGVCGQNGLQCPTQPWFSANTMSLPNWVWLIGGIIMIAILGIVGSTYSLTIRARRKH
jgi:hypothetical protein